MPKGWLVDLWFWDYHGNPREPFNFRGYKVITFVANPSFFWGPTVKPSCFIGFLGCNNCLFPLLVFKLFVCRKLSGGHDEETNDKEATGLGISFTMLDLSFEQTVWPEMWNKCLSSSEGWTSVFPWKPKSDLFFWGPRHVFLSPLVKSGLCWFMMSIHELKSVDFFMFPTQWLNEEQGIATRYQVGPY